MKKQNTLDFLVKHLKQWPTDKKYAPVVEGYRWVKYAGENLFLYDDINTKGDLKITRKDWFLAQLTKESTDGSTGKAHIKFEGKEYITGVRGNVTPKTKQKIYIAGGMTGYENFNRKSFNDAALKLSMEYIVLNPAILPSGLSQKDYMSICLPMVACCDVIYMLDGYEDSGGALAELALAENLGLKVILETK